MWKIGIHNCYWLGSGNDELYDALNASAASGADVYEMNSGVFTKFSRDELVDFKKRADDLGLGLSVNGGFALDTDISGDDPSARRKGIDLARTIIEGMAIVGAKSWSGINYGAWTRVPDPGSCLTREGKARVRDQSVASLKEISKVAENNDVTLCFEVVNRYEQFICNTIAEGVDLAERVGSGSCKVLIDTFHMNIEEDSITDAIRYANDHNCIGEVHVGESNRRIPGTGKTHLDWPAIFGTLKDIRYDGLITMEPFLVDQLPISSKICVWRDLTGGIDAEGFIENVRKGVKFIRSFE